LPEKHVTWTTQIASWFQMFQMTIKINLFYFVEKHSWQENYAYLLYQLEVARSVSVIRI
jgi:hypothetical protein